MSSVRTAGGADRARIAAVLARAFADDPAMSWIYPDRADRERRLPRLFALLFDADQAGMRLITDGGEAATLWRGPGQASTGPLTMIRRAWPMWRALGSGLPRALALSKAIDAHMPNGDFWYLHVAGCDPAAQGRGLGGQVIRAGLSRVAGRFPTYLETATEQNIGLYQRRGFAVTDEWRVGLDGPRFWSMLRPPD
ncbi:GNAT family N-acetyltransferase [Sphingomonas mucosissima]|uniref:Mycothiol acetyltransferase n=1 Tax=Sphingomonas mucosissima TaxID=370959 RepID=A0A245ZEG2_9SPHN|nr:GNAT family N-acetyltransferase [Sphingomonas mucosissima]OWK28135.1 mycothiol acetyltransferase [Sphingomonas mucosissima]